MNHKSLVSSHENTMLFVNAQWTKSNRYPLNKKISPHHVEQAPDIHNIKCHAPRERVSWNDKNIGIKLKKPGHAPRERVSWNSVSDKSIIDVTCHAPRERVSWNYDKGAVIETITVTLHVSVWVEIWMFKSKDIMYYVTLHVSVWVEIRILCYLKQDQRVTLHVSVWVEIM